MPLGHSVNESRDGSLDYDFEHSFSSCAGCAPQMGCQDDLREFAKGLRNQGLLLEDIKPCGEKFSRGQALDQGLLVDDFATSGIDDD